jgi:hypothetical protein
MLQRLEADMDRKQAERGSLTWLPTMVFLALAAACNNAGGHSESSARSPVTLTVHVGLFGGPPGPDGGMAVSNSAAARVNVTATNAVGVQSTAKTNSNGRATMRLMPGQYTVFSTYCGTGVQTVSLTANRSEQMHIICPIR